jgi:uncharacterized membrane protein YgaE (UPF0421/DUF939 family)
MSKRLPKLSPIDLLEKEGNDVFLLLDAVGPSHFGADQLYDMRETVKERLRQYDRWQRINWYLLSTALGWVFALTAAYVTQQKWMARMAFVMIALTFVLFVVSLVLLNMRYKSRGELSHTLQSIEDELYKRSAKRSSGARKN